MYRLKIVINCLDFCRIYYLYIYILLWSNFVIDLVLITHFFVAMASRGGKKNETSGSVVQFRLASRRTLLVYIPPSITVDTMKLRDYNGNFTDDQPLSPFRDMLRLPIRFEWHAFGKMCQRDRW